MPAISADTMVLPRLPDPDPAARDLAPHRGFETVTYMIDGIFRHQDSNGGGGLITDGDTQWMTAGAGLSFCQRE